LTAHDEARYWSEIAILLTQATFNAAVKGVSRRNIAMTFGTEKLEWRGYPVLKNSEDTITRFDGITNVTDGRTDRQTHRHCMME